MSSGRVVAYSSRTISARVRRDSGTIAKVSGTAWLLEQNVFFPCSAGSRLPIVYEGHAAASEPRDDRLLCVGADVAGLTAADHARGRLGPALDVLLSIGNGLSMPP